MRQDKRGSWSIVICRVLAIVLRSYTMVSKVSRLRWLMEK